MEYLNFKSLLRKWKKKRVGGRVWTEEKQESKKGRIKDDLEA